MTGKRVSAIVRVRTTLMTGIQECLQQKQLTQEEAARLCGITQPRISDLMCSKVGKFSVDALINIAATAGLRIDVTVKGRDQL
jgi:predicted XRE-type DNA-binding protein